MIGQVDSNGNLSGPFPYDPYGGSSTTGTQSYGPFQFAAQEHDVDYSGGSIYYMRARYYLPLIARFISRDPAGGGVNPYVYAGDSPTNLTDPTGMDQAGGWTGEDVASGYGYGGGCCANDFPSIPGGGGGYKLLRVSSYLHPRIHHLRLSQATP